jgi:hypothetical protein
MFSLAQAHKELTAEGAFADPHRGERLEQTIGAFMALVEAARNYPCAKKAWYEFLGEPLDAATARAD